jgi:hypothetical protein
MRRRGTLVVLIVGLAIGAAGAETLKGRITRVEGAKVTFQAFDKDTKKYRDAKVYEAAKGVKVLGQPTKDAEKKPVDGGLESKLLQNLARKGRTATITVDDASRKVTEIILHGGNSPKKKKP